MFGQTVAPTPEKKVANIDENQISTNQSAIPVPYFNGRRRLSLNHISPAYNVRTEKISATTGKDQTSTVGFVYYGDGAAVLACVGRRTQMSRVFRIIVEGEIEWEGAIVRDTDHYEPITVVGRGSSRIYWGDPDQPVDDLVLTPITNTIPPGVDPRDTTTWPGGDWTSKHP